MRKKGLYLASFVATLLLVLLLGLATSGVRASPGTLYVATTGSDSANNCRSQSSPCASIGHALSQVFAGDTIKVAQGTYTENITIDKDVTLEGGYESTGWTRDIEAYETIIDGSGSQTIPGEWDGSHTYGPAVISDTGVYKMWYSGRDLYGTWRIGYAESSNGIDWTKSASNPVLEPGSSGEWDEEGVIQMSVMKDGTTYKMWYTGWDEDGLWQIGYATSTNGLDWVKHAGNPVLEVGSPGAWNEEEVGDPSVILDGATYKMWYYGSGGVGSTAQIGHATSQDGFDWTESVSNPVLTPGSSGEWDDEHVWTPDVLKENGTYRMWYAGSDGDTQRIGYATSPDGVTWNKYTGNPVLDVGSGGEWDEDHVYLPMVISDTNTYKMWYTGQNSDGDWRIGYATSPDGTTWTKYANNPVLTPGAPGQWGQPVVRFDDGSDGSVLDGFTVQNGETWRGGGIAIDASGVTVENSVVTGNTAYEGGGGIYVAWGADATIRSTQVLTNTTSRQFGGGILVVGVDAHADIRDSLIANNRGAEWGGAGVVVDYYASATLVGNEIVSNTCPIGSYGGGVRVNNRASAEIIQDNVIAYNEGSGIAVTDNSTATMTGNTISANTTNSFGGGIHLSTSNATISDNTITGNNALYSGGGIWVWGGSLIIESNTIVSNTAQGGGGVDIGGGSSAEVYANTIAYNRVGDWGSGGMSIGDGSVVTATNNIVASNVATVTWWDGDGIAVWGEQTHAELVNNTIVYNSAEGVQSQDATVLVRNNIIASNALGIHDLAGSSAISIDHNDVWSNGENYLNVSPGAGDISVNPLFVDVANGDYHLMLNSLVIDRGTNVGAPSTDFDGEARPFDGDRDGRATVDMGADEYVWSYIYLPLILKNY